VIAVQINGNAVLTFFYIFCIMKLNLIEKLFAHGVKKCFVVEPRFSCTCPQELASRRYPNSDLAANYIIFL